MANRATVVFQVKYVQARDAGVYECQVGTEPKMSHFVQLNVVGACPVHGIPIVVLTNYLVIIKLAFTNQDNKQRHKKLVLIVPTSNTTSHRSTKKVI